MADEQKKEAAANAAPTTASNVTGIVNKFVPNISGLLDGLGETAYKLITEGSIIRIIVVSALGLLGIDKTRKALVDILNRDPDGSLAALKAEQRERMYHMVMYDTEKFLKAMEAKLKQLGAKAWEKGSLAYNYLKAMEIPNADQIVRDAQCRTNALRVRRANAQNKGMIVKVTGVSIFVIAVIAANSSPWVWVPLGIVAAIGAVVYAARGFAVPQLITNFGISGGAAALTLPGNPPPDAPGPVPAGPVTPSPSGGGVIDVTEPETIRTPVTNAELVLAAIEPESTTDEIPSSRILEPHEVEDFMWKFNEEVATEADAEAVKASPDGSETVSSSRPLVTAQAQALLLSEEQRDAILRGRYPQLLAVRGREERDRQVACLILNFGFEALLTEAGIDPIPFVTPAAPAATVVDAEVINPATASPLRPEDKVDAISTTVEMNVDQYPWIGELSPLEKVQIVTAWGGDASDTTSWDVLDEQLKQLAQGRTVEELLTATAISPKRVIAILKTLAQASIDPNPDTDEKV